MYNTNTRRGFTQSCFSKGFTLIELLVVVLIIGILAAVAVPQYQKAIYKTRFANLRVTANSLNKAVQVFYLSNATWPDSFEKLEVDFQGQATAQRQCKINDEMYCCLLAPQPGNNNGQIVCGHTDYSFAYKKTFARDTGGVYSQSSCVEQTNQSICHKLFPSLPPTTIEMITPNGYVSSKEYYRVDKFL